MSTSAPETEAKPNSDEPKHESKSGSESGSKPLSEEEKAQMVVEEMPTTEFIALIGKLFAVRSSEKISFEPLINCLNEAHRLALLLELSPKVPVENLPPLYCTAAMKELLDVLPYEEIAKCLLDTDPRDRLDLVLAIVNTITPKSVPAYKLDQIPEASSKQKKVLAKDVLQPKATGVDKKGATEKNSLDKLNTALTGVRTQIKNTRVKVIDAGIYKTIHKKSAQTYEVLEKIGNLELTAKQTYDKSLREARKLKSQGSEEYEEEPKKSKRKRKLVDDEAVEDDTTSSD